MGHRREARETAVQIWYQIDLSHCEPEEAIRLYWRLHPAPADVREFAEALARGTAREQADIDRRISAHSTHWRLPRMAAVDRNVLRVAVYELLHCPDIPIRVTLNEAIEIGKKYGSEESGAFINGILDQIAKEVDKPLE